MTRIISIEEEEKIVKALKERNAVQPCLRCGHDDLFTIDGYFKKNLMAFSKDENITSSDSEKTFYISTPTGYNCTFIGLICKICGYLYEHEIRTLGLIPPND